MTKNSISHQHVLPPNPSNYIKSQGICDSVPWKAKTPKNAEIILKEDEFEALVMIIIHWNQSIY